MLVVASQKSNPVFGLVSLTSGQKKPLTDAVFSNAAAAPNVCRGFEVQLRTGAAKIADKADATDGWTLTAGVPFGDDTASSLEGWYVIETGASTATVEIICRTGGAS